MVSVHSTSIPRIDTRRPHWARVGTILTGSPASLLPPHAATLHQLVWNRVRDVFLENDVIRPPSRSKKMIFCLIWPPAYLFLAVFLRSTTSKSLLRIQQLRDLVRHQIHLPLAAKPFFKLHFLTLICNCPEGL